MNRILLALAALLFALPSHAHLGMASITPNTSGAAAITWNSSATYKQGQIVTYALRRLDTSP